MLVRSQPFSTYLFDLDGTLIDSIDLIMSSFRHTMLAHLGEVPEDRGWRSGFGTPLRNQLEKFARTVHEADAMMSTYVEFAEAHHDRMVEAYPGIHQALTALRVLDKKMGIVTSKNRRAMWRGLRRCGLDGYFEGFVTVDDVKEHKPHPAPLVAALDQLSAEAGAAVFIGDSPHDVAAGRAAGVRTAAALWGPFSREDLAQEEPDHWLSHPIEIETLSML